MAQPSRRLDMFGVVEEIQGDTPWGSMLDAGTGARSARWMSGLASSRWTAVSADAGHLAVTRAAVADRIRPQDRLVLGNWQEAGLLAGERHETVLAEYLLGAVESYAPYFQDQLFARLRPLVGGRLYVIGVDPDLLAPADADADSPGALVHALVRLRDGASLLAGVTPYREYPAEWVMQQLERTGLRLVFARRFPLRHDAGWIERQAQDCRRLLELIADPALARALGDRLDRLVERATTRAQALDGLAHGHDYIIAAVPA